MDQQRRQAGPWTRPIINSSGLWTNPGRKRRSGLSEDHDGAGGLDSLISVSLRPGAVAIASDPGICPACGAAINPLTMGCRC